LYCPNILEKNRMTTRLRLVDVLRLTIDRISTIQDQPVLEFNEHDDPVLCFLNFLLTTLEINQYQFKDGNPEKAIQFLKSETSGWKESTETSSVLITSKEKMEELKKLAEEQLLRQQSRKSLGMPMREGGWKESTETSSVLITNKEKWRN